ncbi:MAG TPA: 2'-deoxycytidine 5'-triphosphate deaminase [Actinomycetes bacterium]|nr:2'-deoxycytidine 5'-triphosphate deaminase [Actinomycetes bacterium]
MLNLPPGKEGVLPSQYLRAAVEAGVISAGGFTIPRENIQPASLDLRLGPVAYPLRCSFLPGRDLVTKRMEDLVMGEVDLREGGALETGRPYLIPLQERLRLLPGMRAKANPKSSTGRADVFTRVITDRSYRFDEIAPGYSGGLYLEVVPLSFRIRAQENVSLNQLRVSVGRASLSDEELVAAHAATPLLYEHGEPVPVDDLAVANGLFLGVNLRGDGGSGIGYRAQGTAPLLDMTRTRAAGIDAYWERIRPALPNRVILERKRFYLLMSNEAVRIPPHLAAEMTAYDPTSGELRTHYAGFFDPGFGYDRSDEFHGSTAALEVRAHDVDFMIEHGQRVCKLTFERMLEEPVTLYGRGIGSSYQQQEETLGKHFLPRRADDQLVLGR